MNFNDCRIDLPIVLFYDLDSSWPQVEIDDRLASTRQLRDAMAKLGHPVREVCLQSSDIETILKNINPNKYLVLNWCEDIPGILRGEYRAAQSLERLGFTFTGSSSRTLALGQNKHKVKSLLQRKQIQTPIGHICISPRKFQWSHFPAIVKPAFEHCSYGITRESVVQSTIELEQRIQYVLDELHEPALVEEFIDGREFHVGVIGNGKLRVLPPGEIDYSPFPDIHDRLCTYESNVDKTSRAYQLTAPKLPAVLTNQELARLDELVIAAYRAIGCRDYARMDVRLRDGVFYLLDVNPNPDISPDTSLSLGAELAGLSYGMLGSLFINLATRRHPILGSIYRQKK